MTIEQLAKKYRLKAKEDKQDGTMIIAGTLGHLYMYDEDENLVGAMFLPPKPHQGWGHRKRELTQLGAVVRQNGDQEGVVSFEAENHKAMRTAMKLLGIKTKKRLSEEQIQKMTANLARARAQRASQTSA